MFGYIFNFGWLDDLVRFLVENFFNLSMEKHIGSAVHFFIYDTIKILILLSLMIFAISYARSFFPPEKTKKILTKFEGIKGNIMGSILGIVTPFCSCSSVPIFIGFVEAHIPLGVTFSFLITSPMVNEAAFVILLSAFGFKVAFLYVLTGMLVGIIGGMIIGVMKLENQVQEYVYEIKSHGTETIQPTNKERIRYAIDDVISIIKKIWLYLIIGIAIGALIHNWAPEDLLTKYAGPNNPFAVIVGVVFGIPLYANVMGTIPITQALIAKGVGLGTALSFMMATIALSVPSIILLKKVVKQKLINIFVLITGIGIILVGYLFNILGGFLI